MEVKIDNDIQDMIERAVTRSLVNKIDSALPKAIEELLTERPKGFNDNLVITTLRAACKNEITAQVAAYVESHQQELQEQIAASVRALLSADSIAKNVVAQLSAIKLTIHPFKAALLDEEDE